MVESAWLTEGSAILFSALLVYFAKKQSDINREQKNLNQYQNSSILRVEDWKYEESEEHGSEGALQPDLLELTCSNYGEASAFDIRAQLHIHGDSFGARVDNLTYKKNIAETVATLNDNFVKVFGLNGQGAAIGSDERNVNITGVIGFDPKMLEEEYSFDFGDKSTILRPSELCNYVFENTDEEDLKVGLSVWYKDGTGANGPIHLQFVSITENKLEAYHGMREIFEKSRPLSSDEIPGEVENWWDSQ